MIQKNIYVLKLQDNKYFIHFSDSKPYKQILNECEILYDYVKIYKPLSVIDIIPLTNYLEIDKSVKFYMYLYGYNNVRGGSYIDEILPDYLEKTLNHEFKIVENEEPERLSLFNEILEKYEYHDFNSIQEIDEKIAEIKKEYSQYVNEKETLEEIKFFNENGEKRNMHHFIPEDMDWLYEICSINFSESENLSSNTQDFMKKKDSITSTLSNRMEGTFHSNYIQKYKKIIGFLKRLFTLFEKYDLFSKHNIHLEPSNKMVYMKYPEFIFDAFVYNTHSKDVSSLLDICKKFQYMGNILINIISEKEFDVLYYGYGYEWKVSRIIYVLEKKKETFGKPKTLFGSF